MNRRGFLGSIAAAVVAARSGFIPKTKVPAPALVIPKLGDEVILKNAGQRLFSGRVVGVALERAVPGQKLAVMMQGACELTRAGEYVSARNESGTVGMVASAPIEVGHFVMTDADGRVRPATLPLDGKWDDPVSFDHVDVGEKKTISVEGYWDDDIEDV